MRAMGVYSTDAQIEDMIMFSKTFRPFSSSRVVDHVKSDQVGQIAYKVEDVPGITGEI